MSVLPAPRAATGGPFADWITEASRLFGVPAHWIAAVISVESAGNPRARSSKGAMGLMQVMPETWSELRLRYRLGADPFNPHDNILAGASYLRELYDRYGWPGLFAAYNAGPTRYDEYLAGRPLPAETQAYLATLTRATDGDELAGPTSLSVANLRRWTDAPLFVALEKSAFAPTQPLSARRSNGESAAPSDDQVAAIAPARGGLFVPRSEDGALQ